MMNMEYKVKVNSVDYCVTEEDVIDYVSDDENIADKIKEIKSDLPQELVLVVTCDCAPEYVEDEIAEAISEETGWLINSFTYDIISETEIEEEEWKEIVNCQKTVYFFIKMRYNIIRNNGGHIIC